LNYIRKERSNQKSEGDKQESEVICMERNPGLKDLFEDPSFLKEIEEARKFKIDFCRRRAIEMATS
jgi:hypothetical protein